MTASGRRGRRPVSLATLLGASYGRLTREDGWLLPHVNHASTERLGVLADLDEFSDFRRWPKTRDLRISATMRARTAYRKLDVDPVQAAHLFGAGATLAFEGVHRWHPVLGQEVRALAGELGLPPAMCHCNVYVSPERGGVPSHFDAHHILVVHLIGAKTWTIAENRSVIHPTENHVASQELSRALLEQATRGMSPAMPRKRQRIVMRPGSALFLPTGYWHATRAAGPAMSLTFGLGAPRWVDLACDALGAKLARHPEWRAPAWGSVGNASQRAAAKERLASLLLRQTPGLSAISAREMLEAASPRRAPRGGRPVDR